MIYPDTFEEKIGFGKLREKVLGYCLYEPGRKEIMDLGFSADPAQIATRLKKVEEFRQILLSGAEFPLENFIDISRLLKKARIEGRFLEESEVFDLKRAMDSVRSILHFLNREESRKFIHLRALSEPVKVFPVVLDRINSLLNKHGRIRDNASPRLKEVRDELRKKQNSISGRLNRIMEKAIREGLVEEDATLSVRNGKTVIPVSVFNKRKIKGYVHDESATGKTVYIEPEEIVEANNELRELELAEKRELIRILTEFTGFIRPYIPELEMNHYFLAKIDSIRARARFALDIGASLPNLSTKPEIDWFSARHPLLLLSFREHGREKDLVPLDVKLDEQQRILVISGPNAGGKSVCLQTAGLLQYMLQTGFLVPMSDNSVCGVFDRIFLDMGDEQSLEDDLSTYSSHLTNMKHFTKNASPEGLILIDELGTGTEPALGAAIAEAVLEDLNASGTRGVITTHYTNLKHFASSVEGMVNGAMLYDSQHLKPLYKLEIGSPGSSFAFEIARKIGLSEGILKNAEARIGQDHVDFDKNLKDLLRDKRYWENKRQRIRLAEKRLSELVERYEVELKDTEKLRKKIISEAKDKAEEMISGANRQIENTIREIREAEAEKEKTREARKKLEAFTIEVVKTETDKEKQERDELSRKIGEVKSARDRIRTLQPKPKKSQPVLMDGPIKEGDFVLMQDQEIPGEVMKVSGRKAYVTFGNLRTEVKLDKLRKIEPESRPVRKSTASRTNFGDWEIGKRKLIFSPEIDVRGKRAEDALKIVNEFIDEAIMVQAHDLRILHGKGNGILRELIRQHLAATDLVKWFGDEHVERGGAGITLVKLDS